MTVELVIRYVKLLIFFALIWGGIVLWNTQGCRKVSGGEMEPSVKRDKWAWINPRARDPETDLNRGDVVFFEYTVPGRRQQRQETVSRVMGLPGDRIKIVKGEVFVNGDKAQELIPASARGNEDFEEVLVPRDCVFLLCDNRRQGREFDSRSLGPIGKWAVQGKLK